MKSFSFLVLVLVLGVSHTRAAEPAASVLSLGPDLGYWRFRGLPADLPPAGDRSAVALVADVRFATATDEGAAAFANWLKSRAKPVTPVYVLLNSSTAPALRARLESSALGPAVVTLAPSGQSIAADVVVQVTEPLDRAAYDALTAGKPIGELLSVPVDKPRNDEAALARKAAEAEAAPRGTGSAATAPRGGARDGTPEPKALPGRGGRGRGPIGPPPAPTIDLVLQRAVQVHQGLTALGKVR